MIGEDGAGDRADLLDRAAVETLRDGGRIHLLDGDDGLGVAVAALLRH